MESITTIHSFVIIWRAPYRVRTASGILALSSNYNNGVSLLQWQLCVHIDKLWSLFQFSSALTKITQKLLITWPRLGFVHWFYFLIYYINWTEGHRNFLTFQIFESKFWSYFTYMKCTFFWLEIFLESVLTR